MSSIEAVEKEIANIIGGIVELEAAYTYPVVELGRMLPALVVLYDGFNQERMSRTMHNLTWSFEFTVYLPADGKRLDGPWERLLVLVPSIVDAFRANPSLNGVARDSMIENGEPIMHTPASGTSQFVGHSFHLQVQTNAS